MGQLLETHGTHIAAVEAITAVETITIAFVAHIPLSNKSSIYEKSNTRN